MVILDRPDQNTLKLLSEDRFRENVKILESQTNGLPAALNLGLQKTDSLFIARMDDDDISHSQRFVLQLEKMLSDPELMALGSQACLIDSQGKSFGQTSLPTRHSDIRRMLLAVNPFIHSSMIYRREALTSVGNYNEDLFVAQDHQLHARLATIGKVQNLKESLIAYRVHPGQHGEYSSAASEKAALRRQVSRQSRGIILGDRATATKHDAGGSIYEFIAHGRKLRNLTSALFTAPLFTLAFLLSNLRVKVSLAMFRASRNRLEPCVEYLGN